MYREIPPADLQGASITVSGAEFTINGIEIGIPASIEHLSTALGSPSEIIEAAGDQYSNDVYEWESQGIFAYARPKTPVAHALGAALDAEHNPRHWCRPGVVELTVNGVDLTNHSTTEQIVQAGFRGGAYEWKLTAGARYFSLSEIGLPPIFVEFEMGRSSR